MSDEDLDTVGAMTAPGWWHEARVTIDGVDLSPAEVTALRVGLAVHYMELRSNSRACGADEHGKAMRTGYLRNTRRVLRMLERQR